MSVVCRTVCNMVHQTKGRQMDIYGDYESKAEELEAQRKRKARNTAWRLEVAKRWEDQPEVMARKYPFDERALAILGHEAIQLQQAVSARCRAQEAEDKFYNQFWVYLEAQPGYGDVRLSERTFSNPVYSDLYDAAMAAALQDPQMAKLWAKSRVVES